MINYIETCYLKCIHNQISMFKNFLKATFRYLQKHKGFSFINIAGLTLGLTVCILIGLFVWDEYSYDTFLPDANRVYRIYDVNTSHDGNHTLAVGSAMYAVTMQQDFPEVAGMTRVMRQGHTRRLLEAGTKKLYEESGLYVDSTFFEVFPLPFIHGNATHALEGMSSIVISTEMAQRFFGDENPVGKQVMIDKKPFQVNAVVEVDPKFHLQFNYLATIASLQVPNKQMTSWGWNYFYNYVRFNKDINAGALQAEFQKDVLEKSKFSENSEGSTDKPFLQPVTDIHLHSADFKTDVPNRGNITYVNALLVIAAFVLLIACFNFINLATATSFRRAKEIGIRKSVGAGRKQLMFQFLGETMFLSFISVILSVILSMIFLPWLNHFTGKHISFNIFLNPALVASLTVLTVLVGVIAGFYPALVLSGFKTVSVLKGALSKNAGPVSTAWLRNGLVVIQFALSVLLIISVIVVYNQVNYLHNKNLGFNKEQIMFFPMHSDSMNAHIDAFKNGLLQAPGVSQVSIGYGFPGSAVATDEIIVPRNGLNVPESAIQLAVDYDYIKTLGLQLVAGRDFLKEMKTDADHAFIINETAVKQLGFGTPQQALGKALAWHPWNVTVADSLKTGKIIGVVKDFNYKSLYDKIETTVLQIFPEAAWQVAVKIKTADASKTIASVKKVWNEFSPDYPLEYKFLDEDFAQMYGAEDKLKLLLFIFTSVAILVGCLGLFGLAAYTAERRRKEVSIRKVLGAGTVNLIVLLSRNFIIPVALSLIIASPVAWFVMNNWLQDFAYRIHIGWWEFCMAVIITISIACITVSFQSIKASIVNPVDSLRMQ